MRSYLTAVVLCASVFTLCSCSYNAMNDEDMRYSERMQRPAEPLANYEDRLPHTIATKEKVVVVNPNVHAWGAYRNGELVRAGLATAGGTWCHDIGRSCKTSAGSFRIQSLGSERCKSTKYPLPRGGAPMPYCMYFNKNQGLHGSPYVMEGNQSHGCVRMRTSDAEWMRFNFATIGTKVIVKSY